MTGQVIDHTDPNLRNKIKLVHGHGGSTVYAELGAPSDKPFDKRGKDEFEVAVRAVGALVDPELKRFRSAYTLAGGAFGDPFVVENHNLDTIQKGNATGELLM